MTEKKPYHDLLEASKASKPYLFPIDELTFYRKPPYELHPYQIELIERARALAEHLNEKHWRMNGIEPREFVKEIASRLTVIPNREMQSLIINPRRAGMTTLGTALRRKGKNYFGDTHGITMMMHEEWMRRLEMGGSLEAKPIAVAVAKLLHTNLPKLAQEEQGG